MANRTANSIKNILSNLGLKILLLGLQFATRTIFIYSLGTVYNGINSLITSILSFLNITELGIGSAIVFAMYKPVAEKDEEKVLQYLEYYKKIYHFLGVVVAVIGLLLMPALPYLMKDALQTVNMQEVYVIYILYLINSVSSFYVFAYRGGLITANQQDYRLTPINYISNVLIVLSQGASLLIFQGIFSFYVYTALPIFISIVRSILKGLCAKKWYPYIKRKPQNKLSKEEKKTLYKRVYAMSIAKISVIINNSLDSIIISAFIGIELLGKYYNYQTIILMVSSFIGILFSSLSSSIGNLTVETSKEYSENIFKNIYFASFWVYGTCAICYLVAIQPFMVIWLGAENVINSISLIIVICLNFLTNGMCMPASMFRDGFGLHYEGRYRPVLVVIANVVFSILFGYYFGIPGVLLATIISRMGILWWFDAFVLYKHAFKKRPIRYLLDYVGKLILLAGLGVGIYFICSLYPFKGFLLFIMNALTAFILSNLVFFLLYRKTSSFVYFKDTIKRLLNRNKK